MKECNNICDVSSCFLCKRCLPDWLPAIQAHKKNFEVKKGEQVFREDEPVSGIYFIFNGLVKVHKRWDQEKELIIRFSGPGDVIGYLGLGDQPIYPVTATALEPLMLCFLSLEFLETTLNVNNRLTYSLMRLLANDLKESHKSMRDLVHMSMKARVAQALLQLKKQFGTNDQGLLGIEITRQDIASYAGVSYETLFKTFNNFINSQYLSVDGKKIYINDSNILQSLVDSDNS